MRRVAVLGRGGAGKSVLARRLGQATGLPVTELDTLFWQHGLTTPDPARWAERQRDLARGDAWILDGDLGPYDHALAERLRSADTVILLDFGLLRCTWRTLRRGQERADYWRWMLGYRRRSLPAVMQAVRTHAPQATVRRLRNPRQVRRFLAATGRQRAAGTRQP
jgi:adenylate kinase family enzyme